MRKFWLSLVSLICFFLIIFGIVEALQIQALTDPNELMGAGGIIAALAGTGLLVADIVLPVPGSLIMMANGAIFGAIAGSFLSVVGGMGATIIGYLMGKSGNHVYRKILSEEEIQQSTRFMQKWGLYAILLSRPVPLLAESVSIMAGVHQLSFRMVLLSSFLGLIPTAVLYAIAGAYSTSFESSSLAFIFTLTVAATFWFVGKYIEKRNNQRSPVADKGLDSGNDQTV